VSAGQGKIYWLYNKSMNKCHIQIYFSRSSKPWKKLSILVWLTIFVLFDSIKFELICSFDKHAVDFMISEQVAEHQLDRWQRKSMIKNPGKENFFLNGRKIVLGWPMTKTNN
jgi:hypothetical protein